MTKSYINPFNVSGFADLEQWNKATPETQAAFLDLMSSKEPDETESPNPTHLDYVDERLNRTPEVEDYDINKHSTYYWLKDEFEALQDEEDSNEFLQYSPEIRQAVLELLNKTRNANANTI